MARREIPREVLALRRQRRRFVGQWVVWVTLAQTAAFALAALVGFITTFTVPDQWIAYGVLVSAGAVQGALLGLGQWTAFYRSAAQIPAGPWVGATVLGGALAWAIALLPGMLELELTETAALLVLAGLAAAVLLVISLPQFLVLQRYRRSAARWVLIVFVAWGLGVALVAAPLPFIDITTPIRTLIVVFAGVGLAAAVTASVVSGFWARSLMIPDVAAMGESDEGGERGNYAVFDDSSSE